MNRSLKQYLAAPYILWMIGFTVIPLAMIAFYGFTDRNGHFTLANVAAIATPEHAKALLLSLVLSLVSTVICLLLAYPLALILRKKGMSRGSFVVFIFILPMWMNFLLRTMAWQTLLEKNGVINSLLSLLRLDPLIFADGIRVSFPESVLQLPVSKRDAFFTAQNSGPDSPAVDHHDNGNNIKHAEENETKTVHDILESAFFHRYFTPCSFIYRLMILEFLARGYF